MGKPAGDDRSPSTTRDTAHWVQCCGGGCATGLQCISAAHSHTIHAQAAGTETHSRIRPSRYDTCTQLLRIGGTGLVASCKHDRQPRVLTATKRICKFNQAERGVCAVLSLHICCSHTPSGHLHRELPTWQVARFTVCTLMDGNMPWNRLAASASCFCAGLKLLSTTSGAVLKALGGTRGRDWLAATSAIRL